MIWGKPNSQSQNRKIDLAREILQGLFYRWIVKRWSLPKRQLNELTNVGAFWRLSLLRGGVFAYADEQQRAVCGGNAVQERTV